VHTKAPAGRLLDLIGIFWVNPFRFPDFFFVFTSRMLVFCGVAAINSFQAIFLLAHLGYQPQDLGSAILLTVVINAAITLLVAPTVGKISDRIGRRKPFVFIAALILAAGLVMAAVSETFGAYLVAVAVIAVGQGVYFSVELALATQVLPDPENPAKDLALINVANNLPVSLVAVLAPMILSFGVGSNEPRNFSALFIAGALAVVVGGILITFIRKAK
jgi:MFS family permease